MIAELIENLEVSKACLAAAEADGKVDRWGVMRPSGKALQSSDRSPPRGLPVSAPYCQSV